MSGEIEGPHPRDSRYLTSVMRRLGGLSDKDRAEELKCRSMAHLYQRLSEDGYPSKRFFTVTGHVLEVGGD